MIFRHGDMLYLQGSVVPQPVEEIKRTEIIEEDEIDKYLSEQDGWIQRQRDSRLCMHGTNGKCQYCMPIAPWDLINNDPWKTEGVKFIPFHSYIRKMQANSGCKHNEGTRCLNCKSFDQPTYKVKSCNKHPPWPEAICTECKPSECRIDSQLYRHVDTVEFQSPEIIDAFLQSWRDTGFQRAGFLYGSYIADEHIPLGIKASVSFIYEPPQQYVFFFFFFNYFYYYYFFIIFILLFFIIL